MIYIKFYLFGVNLFWWHELFKHVPYILEDVHLLTCHGVKFHYNYSVKSVALPLSHIFLHIAYLQTWVRKSSGNLEQNYFGALELTDGSFQTAVEILSAHKNMRFGESHRFSCIVSDALTV